MFEDVIAQYGTKFLIAAGAVVLGLACLALVLWVVRRRPSSPFIRGGRNRQPRLSVLDAAAVDARRRLVLVRRDDVEHLLMIGGPTDIVVESRIISNSAIAAPEEREPSAARAVTDPAPPPAVTPAAPPPVARPAPAAPRPVAAQTQPEPAPAVPAGGVSAMGRVLYGGEPAAAVATQYAAPPQAAPAATGSSAPAPTPAMQPPAMPSPPQSSQSAMEALDRARQRVLTNPVGTGSDRIGQREPAPIPDAPAPPRTTDHAALVSEFEKILEAEITAAPARPTPVAGRVEPAVRDPQTAHPKSREETEAEMARLLGELSANRKS